MKTVVVDLVTRTDIAPSGVLQGDDLTLPAFLDRRKPGADARRWAGRIAASWRQSVDAIIETGKLLLAAQACAAGRVRGDGRA